jgi:hypothetical protein
MAKDRSSATPTPGEGVDVLTRRGAPDLPENLWLRSRRPRLHHMHSGVGEPLGIEVTLAGQGQNDVREREARRVDRLRASADAGCELRPRVVQRLPHGPHLIRSKGRLLDKLTRFHSDPQ